MRRTGAYVEGFGLGQSHVVGTRWACVRQMVLYYTAAILLSALLKDATAAHFHSAVLIARTPFAEVRHENCGGNYDQKGRVQRLAGVHCPTQGSEQRSVALRGFKHDTGGLTSPVQTSRDVSPPTRILSAAKPSTAVREAALPSYCMTVWEPPPHLQLKVLDDLLDELPALRRLLVLQAPPVGHVAAAAVADAAPRCLHTARRFAVTEINGWAGWGERKHNAQSRLWRVSEAPEKGGTSHEDSNAS